MYIYSCLFILLLVFFFFSAHDTWLAVELKSFSVFGVAGFNFSSSGREDVDVRTLGNGRIFETLRFCQLWRLKNCLFYRVHWFDLAGRPFAMELLNPHKSRFSKEQMKQLQEVQMCPFTPSIILQSLSCWTEGLSSNIRVSLLSLFYIMRNVAVTENIWIQSLGISSPLIILICNILLQPRTS